MIGKHRDGATEFAIGEHILYGHGKRLGWEVGAMLRPRHDGRHELDALTTIYIGWR